LTGLTMENPLHPLDLVVRRLDALGPKRGVGDLARAIDVEITPEAVALFVSAQEIPHSRTLVVKKEHYELFVTCRRAGHEGVPHDHGASASAFKIVQGAAIECRYSVAADGFADLDSQQTLEPGDVVSLAEFGAHSIRCASPVGPPLIALQVYAPPSQSVRRLTRRLQALVEADKPHAPMVGVIGGGFSGAMITTQLLRSAFASLGVALIEMRGAIGEGVAYSTPLLEHLLNVPAGRMSALPDRPNDFVQWALRRDAKVTAADYLPRKWYGEYIRDALASAVTESAGSATLDILFDEARYVARRSSGGWTLHFDHHSSINADAIVLAIGHSPPSDPLHGRWLGPRTRYIADPWNPFAMDRIGPDDRVLILGSGLTAVDAVLALRRQERSAEIILASPRGLSPQRHAPKPLAPADLTATVETLLAAPEGVQTLALLRAIRRAVRDLGASGLDWRAVVDGLRPHTIRLWRAMSRVEREKFLARVRPFWEAHRHRMALSVGETFARMLDERRLRLIAGRVELAREDAAGVTALVRRFGAQEPTPLVVEWIVNCTGPRPSNTPESNPVVDSLLAQRRLCIDPLRLGVETTEHGEAIGADGGVVTGLFVVGTLRKPADWESTAVPELREQASSMARCVADYIAAPGEGRRDSRA
jgi:uncharacterized NAD(P)/FAD-binding protein YdhS